MDQNTPARFLDTAYDALKANPNATNQILQAAAKGAPVGLRGLAAAAAQQSQQQAQQAMAALRQQGAQPNIIQKLAHAGIMSQMDTGLPGAEQMAPQMGAPQEMPPQMMAGGGLVSFADGGNVLPPDVIDAIQSHFASGGDVRGFAEGDELMALLRGAAEDTPYGEMGSFIEGPGATPRAMPADYGPMGSFIEGAPREAPSKLDMLKKFFAAKKSPFMTEAQKDKLARQINWNMIEGGGEAFPSVPESVSKLAGKAVPVAEFLGKKVLTPAAILSDPVLQAATRSNVGLARAVAGQENPFAETSVEKVAYHLPELAGKGIDYLRNKFSSSETPAALSTLAPQDFAPSDMYKPEVKEDKAPAVKTWQADSDPHTGTQATPKQIVHEEGQKVDKAFEQAKVDTGAKTTDQQVEAAKGLEALGGGNLEQMRDLISGLRGHKELSPEMAQQLEDLKSSARTSTILQSVLGALGGGLTDPYGGRFALGRAALGALSGYQKGVGSEEEIGRKGFDILRGYSDAPAEEQAASTDKLLGMLEKAADRQSAERVAESKEDLRRWETILKGEQAQTRAETIAGGQQAKLAQGAKAQAEKEYNDWLEGETKSRRTQYNAQPITDAEKNAKRLEYYSKYGVEHLLGGLGASQSQVQSTGLGGTQIPMFTRQR